MTMRPRLSWQESIWFFDIDDTLIDTAGTSLDASKKVAEILTNHLNPQQVDSLQKAFNQVFLINLSGHQAGATKIEGPLLNYTYDQLQTDISNRQKSVVEKYGAYKKWSREVFLKIAADKLGFSLTSETIQEAIDAYWIALSQQTIVFPSALELIKHIKAHQRPIYFITSSDARLNMDSEGQFSYDPIYSEGLKRQRIELLRDKGLDFNAVSIGDPEDKPTPEFFLKGVNIATQDLGREIELNKSIMVGDSFSGDLQTPKEKLGFGLVVLFNKGINETVIIDEREVHTGHLAEIATFLF